MPQSLRNSGDLLERRNIDFIETRLPGYAALWQDFFGNDGTAHLPLQDALDDGTRRWRLRASHYSYSALESILCAARLIGEATTLYIRAYEAPGAEDDLLRATDILISFFAHVGRVRDCAHGLWKKKRPAESLKILDSLYDERSLVLHDAKIPVYVRNGSVEVARPEEAPNDELRWGDPAAWSFAAKQRRIALKEYLPLTFDRLVEGYDRFLHELRKRYERDEGAKIKSLLKRLADLVQEQGSPARPLNISATTLTSIYIPPRSVEGE